MANLKKNTKPLFFTVSKLSHSKIVHESNYSTQQKPPYINTTEIETISNKQIFYSALLPINKGSSKVSSQRQFHFTNQSQSFFTGRMKRF